MIGVFDSGYGGLTVLTALRKALPQYDYLYLGDNARAPYGNRSFESVYEYTLEAVKWFFAQGCPLIILACNTASAKALRTIQQNDLPFLAPENRVLGVIRPTSETIGDYTRTKQVGIMATAGTVASLSYPIEIKKFYPEVVVTQQACPVLVPLIENNELETEGMRFFIKKYTDALLAQNAGIDTVLLACTHYPLIKTAIEAALPTGIQVITQGEIIAASLIAYFQRHPEMELRCSKNGQLQFYTTDDPIDFDVKAGLFFGEQVKSRHAALQAQNNKS